MPSTPLKWDRLAADTESKAHNLGIIKAKKVGQSGKLWPTWYGADLSAKQIHNALLALIGLRQHSSRRL